MAKGTGAPYARRSVWYAVIALAALFVVGFGVAGYEIYHLHNQVHGLQADVTTLQQGAAQLKSVLGALVVDVLKLTQGK